MRLKRSLLLILCMMIALHTQILLPAAAQEAVQKTVKVGWYESAFHRTDEFGRKSGYGYEYQQRIAIYSGWNYEYVEGSWSELFEKLVNGEIDLLSDVSYTPERAEKILYSAEAMGTEDYHLFISPTNTEIRPDDFSTLNGKLVGVNKNSIQEKLFIDWAKNHNVTPEITELTGKTPELLEMLARGEIDALVTLDTYATTADIISVCKIGSSDVLFGISKSRPDLKQDLDMAMNRIFEDNRNFNQQMTEKYHKAGSVNSFLTENEQNWVTEHGKIRVGYRDNDLPFCALSEDGKTLTGMLADYLAFAETCEKNAKLSFETRAFQTAEEMLKALADGEIDCAFPSYFSSYDGEQRGVIITDPLVINDMFAMVRTADRQGLSKEQEMKVAVPAGNPSFETFLNNFFPKWQIVYYPDAEAGYRAVASGEADCGLVSNYRISRISDVCTKYGFATLATNESMEMCFAVRKEDSSLFSILNKVTHRMPEAMMNTSLTRYAFRDDKVSLVDFLRDNLGYVIAGIVTIIAIILLLVLRSARAEAKAKAGSRIISETELDRLTGLYNREFFLVYANRMYKEHPEKPMDAVAVDIERFHSLTSLNGRTFGNEVLKTLGHEITAFLKENGGIGSRSENDHFDLYCAHREGYEDLLARFTERLNELSRNADIQLRMGVMPWQKELEPEQMLDRAWSAARSIRGHYKTHLMVYDEELRHQEEMNQRLRNDLTRALEEGEMEVWYQPKFDIQVDPPVMRSAEALVRWHHPRLGMITPDVFIPLFERSGQITALDSYVWAQAARQIAAWREKYGRLLPVSVNLSRVDVFDPKLMATLEGIVAENRLNRSDLTLEITESAYTENADHLIQVIEGLREKGYVIEMDDFGSGYSSLNMLSSLPVDVLKMDIAFIRNIERNERDFHLVELILDIARYLKVPVVAEGVETEKQLKQLKEAGCDLVQGYYFSRPLPPGEFEERMFK